MQTSYPAGPSSEMGRQIAEGGKERIPERLLAKLWKERASRQTSLRTQAGKRVRVVYPGRPGVTAGPDFRDALLDVEGVGLVRGDVELHIKQADWQAHGHGGDPNYNGVVVHGALEVSSLETRLHSGSLAPVMDLSALLTESSGPEPFLDLWQELARKGFPRPETLKEAEEALDRAGDERFRAKADWLLRCIQSDGPDQALYQALMEGLGYSSNRSPFLRLAAAASYPALAKTALQLPAKERAGAIGQWLVSCAGLGGPGTTGRRSPRGMGPAMDRREWRLFRVRPANHPRRRILGAAIILTRFLEQGLAVGLREEAQRLRPAGLAAALCAVSEGGPAYVGRARAKDLAVNAVLPFLRAWEQAEHGSGGDGLPEILYQKFPLSADNEVTREMTEQLLPPAWRGVVSSARRQQGLLHLSALMKGAH